LKAILLYLYRLKKVENISWKPFLLNWQVVGQWPEIIGREPLFRGPKIQSTEVETKTVITSSVVDPKLFITDPNPDPTFQ
jgi:hypothetical protein